MITEDIDFTDGDRVKITAGKLKGLQGIVEKAMKKATLKVVLDAMGLQLRVKIDKIKVKKLDKRMKMVSIVR